MLARTLDDLVLFGISVQVDATFVAELVMTKQAVEQVGVFVRRLWIPSCS